MKHRGIRSPLWFIFYHFNGIRVFLRFLISYIKKKLVSFSIAFERNKNRLVKFFIMKRGRYNRPFLHLITMGVLGLGVLVAPFLADTYPIFSSRASQLDLTTSANTKESILVGQAIFQTEVSQKPRDKIVNYIVEKGDTISTVANKFAVSEDTIKWGNDLSSDDLSVGQQLSILPVTGIAYKVLSGDSIYSIAKKYNTDPQKIVDFPFNEFAGNGETFDLITGQILIVPDGIKPSEQPYIKPQVYVAQGPIAVSKGGWFFPVQGEISQYASWYHMALDIAGSVGAPIYAAHSGTVSYVGVGIYDGGYGTNVWIDNGDGIKTHYAHLNGVNVSVGQQVSGGQSVIGWRGNTGRSTGPHTHFEIQVNGSLVNPLSYVSP